MPTRSLLCSTLAKAKNRGCRSNTEDKIVSSTSPAPLGGADCPGFCRGADAADAPGRVFAFSSKLDVRRPGFIEGGFRRRGPEKTRIRSDHLSDRHGRVWETYAIIGMGLTGNIEYLRAALVQRSSRKLSARREERGGDFETAVPFIVQTKRGSRDVREKRNIPLSDRMSWPSRFLDRVQ